MHLFAELTAASWMLEQVGEVRANFSLQLSLRTHFAKMKIKIFIAENHCENRNKLSFFLVFFIAFYH